MFRLRSCLATLVAGAVLAALPLAAHAQTKIKMVLNWKYQGPQAWFFMAQDKGYFKAEGLDVEIDQGEGSSASITKVAAGASDADLERSLARLGMAVSYNIMGGPPAADVFAELREQLGRSLAVRVFSMHTFDADVLQRRALMQAAIDAMASGAVRAPRATVLPLSEACGAHELLDAPDTVGKIVLHP